MSTVVSQSTNCATRPSEQEERKGAGLTASLNLPAASAYQWVGSRTTEALDVSTESGKVVSDDRR